MLKKIRAKDPEVLIKVLDELLHKKVIAKSPSQKYSLILGLKSPQKAAYHEGYVDMAKAGFAYIICQDGIRDVYVAQKNLQGADDGDLVRIALFKTKSGRQEGVVDEVLQRARTQLVGVIRFFNDRAIVFAQSGRRVLEMEAQVPAHMVVEEFDRVILQITHYKQRPRDMMKGVVIKNLGRESSIDVEMQSILADKGFPLEWNQKIIQQLQNISGEIKEEPHRRDLRNVQILTIDPYDARDFDDALSLIQKEDGQWELGVHIADVGHYVPEGSPLDLEARYRGNSVYLVDRVLPMLPEKLSNELCSLRPHEDKYCFSVLLTLDADLKIIEQWIGKTIIHSKRRFTYEEVQEILEGKPDDYGNLLGEFNRIAKHYRAERLKHGAIDFDSEEVKFKLSENGLPIALQVKERKDAHMLVEEFMLLANKKVAAFMGKKQKNQVPIPFVYRIHDAPDPEKLEMFQSFARELGVYLDFSTPKKIAQSLNKLTELSRKDDKLKVLQPLAIRAMSKASYSTQNIGHYGLAFPEYAHFTSPIRRYADLMVHRILLANLNATVRVDEKSIERTCLHISNQERKAMEAERESNRYFQVLFLKNRIGEEFEGSVVGMNERGLFVELSGTKCEGFLPYSMIEETLSLHSSRLHAVSSLSDKKWTFGDKIRVRLEDADLDQKELLLFPVL